MKLKYPPPGGKLWKLSSKVIFFSSNYRKSYTQFLTYGPKIKCICVIADDFLTRFVRIITDEGFTSLMVSIEHDTGTSDDVLFKQLVDISILFVKEMKLCYGISNGIKTNSHGNTRKRNGMIHKVNVFLFVKFIHVFNSLNHRCDVQIVIPFKKISKS